MVLRFNEALNFAIGETTKVVRVELSQDSSVEALEYFSLRLLSPVNATTTTASATVTIVDDDSG